MRIASQALRRASIDRGLQKQVSSVKDSPKKETLRRRSLVNLSPTTTPAEIQKAAGRSRKMSRSLTQENLDVAQQVITTCGANECCRQAPPSTRLLIVTPTSLAARHLPSNSATSARHSLSPRRVQFTKTTAATRTTIAFEQIRLGVEVGGKGVPFRFELGRLSLYRYPLGLLARSPAPLPI